MPTFVQYSTYGQAALGSYATGLVVGEDNTARYRQPAVGMALAQAAKFDETWKVVQQSMSTNGFSAVLLQRKDASGNATGEKVLAIAGTDGWEDLLADILIGQYGTVFNMPQYASLESFHQQLVSSGKLGAGEQVVVTGHSLGGFLAQAFTVRNAGKVSAAYTYNAPGFGRVEQLLGFFGITDTSAAAKITNVHATDGLSFTAGLGTLLGASQGVRIEEDTANPLNNHSIVRLGDALAIYSVYAGLQPSLSTGQIETQLIASGYRDRRLEDSLDAFRTVFVGPGSNQADKTPTADRDRFYTNLYALQNEAGFKALSGQVQLVQANSGFAPAAQGATDTALAYRYALLELLPLAVVANTDVRNLALYGEHAQLLSLYDAATGAGELTGQWIADRAAMLDWLIIRNKTGVTSAITGGLAGRTLIEPANYEDKASSTRILVGATDQLNQRAQYVFGGDADETIDGTGRKDHLYGGAGNDALRGQGGADYLEGNSGADALQGGDGDDRLLGGKGFDTYHLNAGEGYDSIIDADGQGSIVYEGAALTLAGATEITDDVYRSADGQLTFTLTGDPNSTQGATLVIDKSIRVENFHEGDLGIRLADAHEVTVPVTSRTIVGDLAPMEFFDAQGNVYYNADELGNLILDPSKPQVRDDATVGSAQGDRISSGGGRDRIDAKDGEDVVEGGADSDTLIGGAGADRLYANTEIAVQTVIDQQGQGTGQKGDWITGGLGDDAVVGGDSNDALFGGGGRDLLVGGLGDDVLNGDDNYVATSFDWRIQTLANEFDRRWSPIEIREFASEVGDADVIYGGSGNDYIIGLLGDDILFGDEGNDTVAGCDGNDAIWGGDGDDRLTGDYGKYAYDSGAGTVGQGNDYIDGESGNDWIQGEAGDDALFGDDGDDVLQGDATYLRPEDHGADSLDGGAGDDLLFGFGGSDVLEGGTGNDHLDGDAGQAELSGEFHGEDFLDGGDGDDTLLGSGGDDYLFGGTGADQLHGDHPSLDAARHGADTLDGGDGDDILVGGGGNDDLAGGIGNDSLSGGEGDDSLDGEGGTDGLFGGAGNDALVSDGRDYLDGGEGDDTLVIDAVGSGLVATVDDAAGRNMLLISGARADASKVFMQDGQWYLSTSSEQLVALGTNAVLSGLVLQSDFGGTPRTVQAIVDESGGGGLVRSGRWSQGSGVTYTANITTAQTIVGGGRAEWLEGGSGVDDIDAGAGADRIDGGAGSDTLRAGAGADTLRGGRGDDTLEAGRQGGNDADQDVYVFARGDGTDQIVAGTLPLGAAKDVIRFEAGITRSDVGASVVFSSDAKDATPRLLITYGAGDRIALGSGAEASIERLEFSDGSSISMTELLALLPPTGAGSVATEADDVLIGTDGNDFIRGRGGNDTLIGGAGDDTLQGDGGRNTYRFSGASGNDAIIASSASEQALLVFEGIDASQLTARIEGDKLVFLVAGGSAVQVLGFAGVPGAASTWQVQVGDTPSVSVAALLASTTDTAAPVYEGRKALFLAEQRIELRKLPQRAYGFGVGATESVTVASLAVDAGGTLEHPGYLTTGERTFTVVQRSRQPIYQTVAALDSNTVAGQRYFSIFDLPVGPGAEYYEVPPGSTAFYGPSADGRDQDALMGYFVPTQGSAFGKTAPRTRIVGYQEVVYTFQQTSAADSILQMHVTGSSANDTISPSVSGDPAQFRGSIESGAGDDVIRLLSYSNGGNYGEYGNFARELSRGEDWAPADFFSAQPLLSGLYERGRGAWIDAGDGDDTVSGTDAHDVIIGGRGNDWLDGQAGEDTYVISREAGAVDHVADVASFTPDDLFEAYGGRLDRQHRDTIEFDETVDRTLLSYRWIDEPQRSLELYQSSELFLQIDYGDEDAGQAGAAGIERFVFLDGTSLTLNQLLAGLPEAEVAVLAPPTLLQPLPDLVLGEDALFTGAALRPLFSDPQGSALTISALLANGEPLPDWLSVDPASGTLSGTPLNADVGTLRIELTATNTGGLSVATLFDVTVTNVNDAPQSGFALPAAVGANQDAAFEFLLPAGSFTDADAGDSLSFAATLANGGALPAWLQIDSTTGRLSGTPPLGWVGSLDLRIEARDVAGASASQSVALQFNAAAPNSILGTPAADLLQGSSASDRFIGYAGKDTMIGHGGNDFYVVENPGDVVTEAANEGTDTVESGITLTLAANVERLVLTGAASINGTGNALDNALYGNSAANRLNGRTGADAMAGGDGDDTYVVDNAGDIVIEAFGEGNDSAESSVSWTMSESLERLILTGNGKIDATGNGEDNALLGNAGANRLDGGAGADAMTGGAGNDTYVVDEAGDTITEAAGGGTDTVESSISWVLGSELEQLTLTGMVAAAATGNDLANTLRGNAGNNVLDGGVGNDTMIGGAGDDIYRVDSAGDVVTESSGQGTDTVESGISLSLAANVENLILGDSSALNGTGNSGANTLTGNSGANRLDGGGGADTLIGAEGDDTYVIGQAGDVVVELAGGGSDAAESSVSWTMSAELETLVLTGTGSINATGNVLANLLLGNSGANRLDGGAGADSMTGGAGNDVYVVDSVDDAAVEAAGGGIDTIEAFVSWALAAELENLTLKGTSTIDATGNALANTLRGNTGDNALDGSAGSDTLIGGAGNDTYVVDAGTDVVTEKANEGADTVRSAVTWTLGSNVEHLTLTGGGAIDGTGNALGNVLVGNGANNALSGGAGNDIYVGNQGNDVLVDSSATSADVYRWGLGDGNDTLSDAGGADRIEILPGVTSSELTLSRSGNNLQIGIDGASDVLTVLDWYTRAANRIEEIRLADGSLIGPGAAPQTLAQSSDSWMTAKAQSLNDAMAQFNAAPVGESTYDRRVWLEQPVLGASSA